VGLAASDPSPAGLRPAACRKWAVHERSRRVRACHVRGVPAITPMGYGDASRRGVRCHPWKISTSRANAHGCSPARKTSSLARFNCSRRRSLKKIATSTPETWKRIGWNLKSIGRGFSPARSPQNAGRSRRRPVGDRPDSCSADVPLETGRFVQAACTLRPSRRSAWAEPALARWPSLRFGFDLSRVAAVRVGQLWTITNRPTRSLV